MIHPPLGKPWLLYGLLGTSLTLNLVLVFDRTEPQPQPQQAVVVEAPVETIVIAPVSGIAPVETIAIAPVVAPAPTVSNPASPYSQVSADIRLNLPTTFRDAIGSENSDALAAVFSRLIAWDLDLRRDLQRGDSLRTAYLAQSAGQIDLPVAWYSSKKLGKTLKAYRYKLKGDTYASYWDENGTEVPMRLGEEPIRDYVQITALVGDRTRHHGMDFKTPVGTPIYAPRAGNVTRINWNWKANGNCIEVRFDDGTLAKFLHLSDESVQVGQRVAAGTVLGSTGNTGRSTAPHLHYQLNRGDRVLDPRVFHGTIRRQLPETAMPRFRTEIARLDALLGTVVARR